MGRKGWLFFIVILLAGGLFLTGGILLSPQFRAGFSTLSPELQELQKQIISKADAGDKREIRQIFKEMNKKDFIEGSSVSGGLQGGRDVTCHCGDIRNDGGLNDLIDFADFALCFRLFGPDEECTQEKFDCSDMNSDGEVNLIDFSFFAGWFGMASTKYPPQCEITECNDDIDNDEDGAVDLEDRDCTDWTDTRERGLAPVSGVTLSGHLEGRQTYWLPEEINVPHCWMDSIHWTGEEIFYAITSGDASELLAGTWPPVYNDECELPEEQISAPFDIYRTTLDSGWQISSQSLNSEEADAGMSLSGGTMAYVIYYMSGIWNIHFVDRVSTDVWTASVEYEYNSYCREDNPEIYADGTKMIFESNRADPLGTSCLDHNYTSLWYSERSSGSWSVPVLLDGPPNEGDKNTQPWVDEESGYIYWTANSECGGCIRRAPFDGTQVTGENETIVTPNLMSLFFGTADGEVIFVGEYAEANDYVFISCAIAREGGPWETEGENGEIHDWSVDIGLCVIPPE